MIEKLLNKVLCFILGHKYVKLDKTRMGIAGGSKCKREGCNYLIPAVEWPAPGIGQYREHPCNRDNKQ